MEIYHQYVKLRKDFGRAASFVDEAAEMLADIRPNEEHAKEHIARNPVTTITSCIPQVSEHEANTAAVVLANKAMNHVEGGWPKEVDCTEAEHVIRYRKKVEKDEDFIKAVVQLGAAAEDIVKANNTIDIYEDYFAGRQLEHHTEAPYAKTATVLRDPSKQQREAQYLCWHPDASRKLAVAYSVMGFQALGEGTSISSYLWDISNPNEPELELVPQSQLTVVNFNQKDTNLLGAGQYNGQFAFFDVRKGSQPVESTAIEHSHRDPIYDFAWLQSKTGSELMSVSSDGQCLWWDIRKIAEPLETLLLKERGGEMVMGASSLECSPAAGPTKFMIGTEQGPILSCNRKAKTPQDRVTGSYPGHHGPVVSLIRHPFYPKFFLSVGDWTARVWNEDLKSPIVTSKYQGSTLTGGRWSPTRPAVLMTTSSDGHLDVYDYMYKQNDPALSLQVADCALTSLRLQESGALAAVGSADGATTLLRLCDGLVDMQPAEKQSLAAMLERESNKEKNLEKALKEAKAKARREAAAKSSAITNEDAADIDQLEREFLASIGVSAAPAESATEADAAAAAQPPAAAEPEQS